MSDIVELKSAEMRCLLLPSSGGGLGGLWYRNQPLMRAASPADWECGDPTRLAGFPLVPFSNRIGYGAFSWAGKGVELRCNHPTEPHAIHGVGWQRIWKIARASIDCASLIYEHLGDADWPWPFRAEQHFSLSPECLTLTMSAINLAEDAVPLAIAYHPYFERAGASLKMAAQLVWLLDKTNLPARALKPVGELDFGDAAPIADREVDNCYEGVAWPACIGWNSRDYSLQIFATDNLGCAVVYSSHARNAFCLEPVPHLSNALNMSAPWQMPVVEPGDAFTCSIEMQIDQLSL